jgi:hypothetical protein
VVTVDEREVHVATGCGELGEQLRQQQMAVADVQVDVRRHVADRRLEVEGMDLGAVGGDRAEAATLRGAELDRQRRPQRGHDALDGGPFAEGHLPVGGAEEVGPAGHRGRG